MITARDKIIVERVAHGANERCRIVGSSLIRDGLGIWRKDGA